MTPTTEPAFTMVYEVVDNSVDEALAGHRKKHRSDHPRGQLGEGQGRRAWHADGYASDGKSANTRSHRRCFTPVESSTKSYKVSGGLHGVGVSAVNALSEWLKLEFTETEKFTVRNTASGRPGDGADRGRYVGQDRNHGDVQGRR